MELDSQVRFPIDYMLLLVALMANGLDLPCAQDSPNHLFEMLKYTVQCANTYFRILHDAGLWLDPSTSLLAGRACHEMTVSWLHNPACRF